jgi:hypothetical protein
MLVAGPSAIIVSNNVADIWVPMTSIRHITSFTAQYFQRDAWQLCFHEERDSIGLSA